MAGIRRASSFAFADNAGAQARPERRQDHRRCRCHAQHPSQASARIAAAASFSSVARDAWSCFGAAWRSYLALGAFRRWSCWWGPTTMPACPVHRAGRLRCAHAPGYRDGCSIIAARRVALSWPSPAALALLDPDRDMGSSASTRSAGSIYDSNLRLSCRPGPVAGTLLDGSNARRGSVAAIFPRGSSFMPPCTI